MSISKLDKKEPIFVCFKPKLWNSLAASWKLLWTSLSRHGKKMSQFLHCLLSYDLAKRQGRVQIKGEGEPHNSRSFWRGPHSKLHFIFTTIFFDEGYPLLSSFLMFIYTREHENKRRSLVLYLIRPQREKAHDSGRFLDCIRSFVAETGLEKNRWPNGKYLSAVKTT